jgi:hypothetical protein
VEFDVFLSHNSKDKPAVRDLARQLTKRGIRVWLDEEQLRPGLNWQTALQRGIEKSMTGAVLVGKDGVGPWEDEEMQALLVLAVRHKKAVIPVLLPGAPEKPALPLFLVSRTWVDLRQGYSDHGMDALVWGITGKRAGTQSTGDQKGTDGQGPFRSRRNLFFFLLFIVCAALAALYLLKPWVTPDPIAEGNDDFSVWIVTERENTLEPSLVMLPLDELVKDRSRNLFMQKIQKAAASIAERDQVRVFRLKDGAEITPGKGDPLEAENRAVLVVPATLVARFPDERVAFTYVRSQLPK